MENEKLRNFVIEPFLFLFQVSPDGSCVLQETITDSVDTNVFNNPRSWFPANTTCSYIFTVPNPQDHISIEFLSFTIERITLCEENIRIFDGLEPDPFRLMNILCDTNKPMVIKVSFSSIQFFLESF